ncbi:MAG: endolytic transglycosylase MltG [Acutalibacteraceae bacterium]|nr:endolytic transglycosylase MltG [Acutalibacteraceae bacterium]
MKRVLFLTLSLILLVSFGACGNNKNQVTPSDTPKQTTTASNTVTLTFPEGYTAKQIAEKLEENSVCAAEDFMGIVQGDYYKSLEYAFIPQIKNAENKAFVLEGYIFPDTYEFYKGESAELALSRFLKNTDAKLTEEFYFRADELGYTMDEIITLASIIQEEASDPKEMSLVSSVLHNRLNSPAYRRLQCDVTRNYVNDCITDSPYLSGDTSQYAELYSTYKCEGLPAGPICNPGIDAIKAALYPEESNYFFFVTDKDWNYYYAETYAEHKKNCNAVGLNG